MALKGKEWFYKQCLAEIKKHGRFGHLSWNVLEKGIGQSDGTRGHVAQAIGVCQEFLLAHPQLKKKIQAADPTFPFDLPKDPEVRNAFKTWLAKQHGVFGKTSFGYSYDIFKNIVPPTLGGTRTGGGGGGDEFKKVLRLMAEFI